MKKLILLFLSILLINSCGIYKPVDARKVPVNANERIKKNMEEGRGFRLGGLGKKGGDFLFSSSNPMWRAAMDKLSFAPLGVVDYGGGKEAVIELNNRLDLIYKGRPKNLGVDKDFANVVKKFQIPKEYPQALIDGFLWDVEEKKYENIEILMIKFTQNLIISNNEFNFSIFFDGIYYLLSF